MVPIASDDHVQRARRTAAWTRAAIGIAGIALLIAHPGLLGHPVLGAVGFATIAATAAVQLYAPGVSLLKVEESLAAIAAILIVGLAPQNVTVLSVLWLAAVASGVLARGGRVHWIGRAVVIAALALPVLRDGYLSAEHAGLVLAALGLLLTIGRLTRELNELLGRARWDADHDDLTGLLSRAAFRARLEERSALAERSAPCSLLLFDLDCFGVINKTAGHAAGDELLTSFGALLREHVADPAKAAAHADTDPDRKTETETETERRARTEAIGNLAGRIGGDEFALVIAGTDALPLAERLLQALPQGGEDVRQLSASVGVAQMPRDGSDSEALLRAADIALRVAKSRGAGGQIATYSGESLSGDGKQSARGALRRLIGGEGLSMAVQPIVDLRTGAIHAYEALARFGPSGADGPLQWFSLADELGERDALERACLRAGLELFAERPPRARLAVNLSAPVLLDRRTLRMLDRPHDLTGLIIEVTEEALVQSEAQLSAALEPLRERGAQVAVDDMGAGYSGLRQVMTVHPTYLKLDRSLVSGVDGDHERAALISALTGYADRVGSLLVAEGIETDAELRALIELGVPLAQGFLLGRPAPPWPRLRPGAPPSGALAQRRARVGAPTGVQSA